MRRLITALGVDYDQWRALTVAWLKLDVRVGSAGVAGMDWSDRSKGASALLGRAFFYGVLGLFVGALVFLLRDRFAAALIVYSYILVTVGTAMLMDLNGVILSPTDYGVLGFRPIPSRTYFAAKLTNVLVYTLSLASLIGLPSTLTFGIRHGIGAGLASLVALYACAMTATLAIVAGYAGLARAVGPERLRSVLSWLQLVFSFFVYGGYFAVSQLVGRSALTNFAVPWSPWLLLYPGTWFAGYIELAAGSVRAPHLAGVIASVVALAALAISMRDRLSLDYVERLGALMSASAGKPARRPARRSWFFRSGEARAVAVLVRSQFRNDLRFRMGVLAILPLTLLYLLIGMSGGRGADGARVPDLALVSMAVLLFPLMLKAQLAHSEAFRAAWIFFATPADRSRLIQSAQRVVVAFFIVPYLVFVGALLAFFVDDLVWLAGWLVVVGLMSNLVLLAETLVKPVVPFSLPPGKMDGTSKMIWIMILVGVLGGVLPFLVGWLASNPGKLGAAAAALIAASVIFARLVRLRVERAATQLEYQA